MIAEVMVREGEGRGSKKNVSYNKINKKIISEYVPYWGLFSKKPNTLYGSLKISFRLFLNFSDCR